MFRTHNRRGENRFLQMRNARKSAKDISPLTHTQLDLLEKTSTVSLGEKIELLCLASGNKLSTEIFTHLEYVTNENQIKIPTPESIERIQEFLRTLPFPYFLTQTIRVDQETGIKEELTWFQVSANATTSQFFQSFPDDLTEFEEGIIYGYPITAIRAFAGLIVESSVSPSNAWCHYLGGVFSKEWINQEDEYYRQVWESLRQISPKIIGEAEKVYRIKQKF